jgi:hypothetical protein
MYISATSNVREFNHLQDDISQSKSVLEYQESRLAVICSAAFNVM